MFIELKIIGIVHLKSGLESFPEKNCLLRVKHIEAILPSALLGNRTRIVMKTGTIYITELSFNAVEKLVQSVKGE